MLRKQSGTWASVFFLVLGVLIGYIAAASFGNTATPETKPLPYNMPLPAELNGQAVDDPGGYSEAEGEYQGYLGVYNQYIAIYQGKPPHGTLQYVTEYEVREDLREQLETGVPFTGTGELFRLLENYTS